VRLSAVPARPQRRPPWLGEHTDEVLAAELGLDPETLGALRTAGVIA
jgi:crotonobetainyl-CoA:carnitine CoA-transferase CaiB-like acyl-CoA transferase